VLGHALIIESDLDVGPESCSYASGKDPEGMGGWDGWEVEMEELTCWKHYGVDLQKKFNTSLLESPEGSDHGGSETDAASLLVK
jgi:hypothetical protein